MNLQEEITIQAPVNQVFDYMMDVNNRAAYIPLLEEVIVLDEGPFQIGTRYTEISTIANRRLETTYQVIDFEENKKISVKTIKSVFPIKVDLELMPVNQNTQVSITMDFKLGGVFRFAAPLVRGIVQKQAQDILQKLKRILESH